MKTANIYGADMDELLRSKLLRHLGERNFDYGESERQQVEYVYAWLVHTAGSDDWQLLTLKLRELETDLPQKRGQRLNRIYIHLKLNNIRQSGRYDCNTLQPPLNRTPYDLGWKL